jgi:uncharacterized linocin/CFP29 family protein
MRRRDVVPIVELRVPFTVSRQAVDEATRGAKDVDWQPVKDAARELAFAEDRTIVDGLVTAGIDGIRTTLTYPPLPLPTEVHDYPATIAEALSTLRLGGVAGPYRLLLSAPVHTIVMGTADHGYPIRDHIERVLGDDGEIVWAPAIEGALAVSARGGDFELHLGQDASIGYLGHDADTIELYIEESMTFQVHAAEAAVALG